MGWDIDTSMDRYEFTSLRVLFKTKKVTKYFPKRVCKGTECIFNRHLWKRQYYLLKNCDKKVKKIDIIKTIVVL